MESFELFPLVFGLIGFLIWGVMMLFIIISTILWVWVLYLLLTKGKFKKDDDKYLWLAVVILGGQIGAAIYYFGIYRKQNITLK